MVQPVLMGTFAHGVVPIPPCLALQQPKFVHPVHVSHVVPILPIPIVSILVNIVKWILGYVNIAPIGAFVIIMAKRLMAALHVPVHAMTISTTGAVTIAKRVGEFAQVTAS